MPSRAGERRRPRRRTPCLGSKFREGDPAVAALSRPPRLRAEPCAQDNAVPAGCGRNLLTDAGLLQVMGCRSIYPAMGDGEGASRVSRGRFAAGETPQPRDEAAPLL